MPVVIASDEMKGKRAASQSGPPTQAQQTGTMDS